MMTFFKQIFQGIRGEYSSKRVVTLFSFLLLCIAFFANLFWQLTIAEFIFNNFTYIVIAGLGMTVAEPIASRLLPPPTS